MAELLKVTARNLELPAEATAEIEARAARLEGLFDRLVACRVTVEGPGGHRKRGKYRVNIGLTVPQRDIAVSHQAEESLLSAVREAFDVAERQLEDYVTRLRGDVKAHSRG